MNYHPELLKALADDRTRRLTESSDHYRQLAPMRRSWRRKTAAALIALATRLDPAEQPGWEGQLVIGQAGVVRSGRTS